MPTIAEAIAEGARALGDAGIEEGRRTASVLLGHVLSLDRAQLIVNSNEQISQGLYEEFIRLIHRRAGGEPLQHITGHQEFYGLDFIVRPDALIPRPETEFLVEQVLKLSENVKAPIIVDVGTGSGCIAVTLAVKIPDARVIATDISRSALDAARANARRHNVIDRIEFFEGDLLAPLGGRGLENTVDFLASNPPYIPASRPESVHREVREWEPNTALFGGKEGIDFYCRLLVEGREFVRAGGYLVCEIGCNQLDAISAMIDVEDWTLEEVTDDLQGIPRTLTLRRFR